MYILYSSLLFLFLSTAVYAFESTKVLPRGVRNINLKVVHSAIDQASSGSGDHQALASPLMRDLTFKDAVRDEPLLRQKQIKGFMIAEHFSESDVLGRFDADLQARLTVTAPIMAYGLTDRFTIAAAVPYYRASTNVAMGFTPSATAERFINRLVAPEHNHIDEALEAFSKINYAETELQERLDRYGYEALGPWQNTGIGDVTVAGKWQFYHSRAFSGASITGITAPTGRGDDPDILTDIPFGDGQWDIFAGMIFDQMLGGDGLFVNEYFKYTHQLTDDKTLRLSTEDQPISAYKKRVGFKLGDKIEVGSSLQFEPEVGGLSGLMTGIGWVYSYKGPDRYEDLDVLTREFYQRDTEQMAHTAQFRIGYSSLPAFQRQAFAVPANMVMSYYKQVKSINQPVSDLLQLDLNLFF